MFVKVQLQKKNDVFRNQIQQTDKGDHLQVQTTEAIEIGLETQLVKQGVKTGLSMILSWVPILKAIPFGSVIKLAGYKGAEKASISRNKSEGIEGDALKDYKHTKAFLLYIGLPSTSETLYQRWVRYYYKQTNFILILFLFRNLKD